MRQFLRYNRWATVLVACFFMLATSGVSMSRMTCLIGGHSVISLGTMDDCCPEQRGNDGPVLKAQCCLHAVVKGEQTNYITHQDVDLAPALIALYAAPRLVLSEGLAPMNFSLETRPPPLNAPDRLAVLCVQRI